MKDLLVCAVHLIIATPGRILDLMNKNLVHADHCKMLVLDEVSSVMCSNFVMVNSITVICSVKVTICDFLNVTHYIVLLPSTGMMRL